MLTDNNIIPRFPERLPGSSWGITVYFNPHGYRNKVKHYRRFRQANQEQGLRLLSVELAFNNNPFELNPEDADLLIRRRCRSVMWQKERLLNIALKALPPDCDKLVWLDADIIFDNDNWIEESCRLLEEYKVLQLFQYVVKLPKDVCIWEEGHLPQRNVKTDKILSKAFKMSLPETASNHQLYGHPGMAWAARRNWLERVGFYDKMILGSADFLMASAFYQDHSPMRKKHFPDQLISDARCWERKVYHQVGSSVYYTPGTIYHLWHGERSLRLLDCRLSVLKKYEFGVGDICLNADECWEWATPKAQLHRWVEEYFKRRNEEGGFLNAACATAKKIREFGGLLLLKKLRWCLGQIGLFLKSHLPAVYYYLKQFKS